MNRLGPGAALVFLTLVGVPAASADRYVYFHPHHPVPPAFGGGTCQIDGVHAHEYVPVGLDQYHVSRGVHLYLGPVRDPALPRVTYRGAHPLPEAFGGGVCPLRGHHTHAWAPEGRHFRRIGVAWVWGGRLPRPILRAPPRPGPPTAGERGTRPHYKAVYERRRPPAGRVVPAGFRRPPKGSSN